MPGSESVALDALKSTRWSGLALPMLRSSNGYFTSKQLPDLLSSSIYLILMTPLGTRVMRPEFGSNLPYRVFEPNDKVLEAQIQGDVFQALQRWEKRIRVLDVITSILEHEMRVRIIFQVLATRIQNEMWLKLSRETGGLLGRSNI